MSFLVPDACTLATQDQPSRLVEFDDLFATALRRVETVAAHHVRLTLAGPAGLEATVRDLTARESRCCSFFTFTIAADEAVDGEAVTLDVEVPGQYADVLAALASRAAAVSAGRAS